ncbi:YqaA family protein [Pseudohongiella sp.]|uniref:VTT domain-containing protein n=1 Tax=marine sediment metagenome TaxID=412755 RepID=A0A0F9YJY7_9ZZZZ|nr:YqaA family protein [Pseudohongiella sp.]HDZ07717.1 DedA family protein [Pseudohongiella sp.]HEA63297.1 DedA family protein [Pseudohongiella sp.]
MSYLLLFITGFVAATLLPASSEVLLLALFQQDLSPAMLWLSATAGNTLGSCVNWYLGREILRFENRRWFPVSGDSLQRAQRHFKRYGYWSLLFAWLPVIGDPLTFVAGVLRMRFSVFFVLVLLGKGARYAVVLLLASQLFAG